MIKMYFLTFNPSAWFHIQGTLGTQHSAAHSASSCIFMTFCDAANNHTEMQFELTCDKGSELFLFCVVATLGKDATYWPNKQNKASG
jgi:hypothetical protein